jgi:Tol biopolymer transport system component
VGDNARYPAISRQGNRLVYDHVIVPDRNVWRENLSDPAQAPLQIIASTRNDDSARYSPDGAKIAFRSERSGTGAVWICDADGSNPWQLTSMGESGSPHWSPDGQRIAFDSLVDGHWQIHTVAARGGKPQQVTTGSSNYRPNWSHDGKWLYFVSERSGRAEIWKIPSGGGNAVEITRIGGTSLPVESEDGQSLWFNAGGGIWRVGVDGSGATRVIDHATGAPSPTHDGIYYFTSTAGHIDLQFYSFATGKSRLIVIHGKPAMGFFPSITPDGHWLLYPQTDTPAGSDLMLVEHFH